MKIINTSREFSVREKYALTKSPEAIPVKNMKDGDLIEFNGYLVFSDTDSKGDEHTMLSILAKDGKTYVTRSETFMQEFTYIYSIVKDADEEAFTIKKLSGTSKSGRPFVTCALV